jgi:hypothetical protein
MMFYFLSLVWLVLISAFVGVAMNKFLYEEFNPYLFMPLAFIPYLNFAMASILTCVFIFQILFIFCIEVGEVIENLVETRKEAILYSWKHKKAFLRVEKILFKKNTMSAYLHDFEKIFLYAIFGDKKFIQRIHRKNNKHHVEYWEGKLDVLLHNKHWIKQMIVDFECARLTKKDKPLNWIETIEKYYPQLNNDLVFKVLSKEEYELSRKEIDNLAWRL